VCPSTLTSHWYYEIQKWCDYLKPLTYTGSTSERRQLVKQFSQVDVVIVSYDVLRNDLKYFEPHRFNYCILDEGHIIRNAKSKITIAVKSVQSNHRLILSGTPIQNNVLELWSLFDFLMPGFLGTQRQFNELYSKPIKASQGGKATSEQQAAGALALEGLHRQVLPFLLRRLKEDVLADLPPKIIQDYPCQLTPLQLQMYESFSQSQSATINASVSSAQSGAKGNTTHVFQALQYLRKVCNHPNLVAAPGTQQHALAVEHTRGTGLSLNSFQLSGKLIALKDLLLECGIGVGSSNDEDLSEMEIATQAVNKHRALIFAQQKGFLDLVQNELFGVEMPGVTFRRLDGSVPTANRHDLVVEFNEDPSIDVLLLTTAVGGLGLNLTGADTVIFLEHDWNPMKDLQAMDRAHRLGQTRNVNVYRLITQGTLEEKIMSLQRFKINIANTVVSSDNASLASMGTDQLLNLFHVDDSATATLPQEDGKASDGLKGMLNELEEMWDTTEYEDYSVNAFLAD
jgi:TATA-binding protein-associated factor